MTVLHNENMSKYASMKTGGAADTVIIPETEAELIECLSLYENATVLGAVTNTVISDKGIRGTVILTTGVRGAYADGCEITSLCGEPMTALARFARDKGLSGLEFAYGIPGTVGGGVYMNAGAYGGEVKNVITEVTAFSRRKGVYTIKAEELGLGYRTSVFRENGDIVLSAKFVLAEDDKTDITAKMTGFMSARREKQPLEYPSCGSTFKRPEGFFAGRLIEDAGLKGKRIGGAEVSEKHAGFVINRGNATTGDILSLVEYIKKTVYEKSGVMLEEEICVVGEK